MNNSYYLHLSYLIYYILNIFAKYIFIQSLSIGIVSKYSINFYLILQHEIYYNAIKKSNILGIISRFINNLINKLKNEH